MTRVAMLVTVLLLAACGRQPAAPEGGKRYPMQGAVKAIDVSAKRADIDAGPIGAWMSAMPLPYPVKPESRRQKPHLGDRITATLVFVSDASYYVTDIKVVKP